MIKEIVKPKAETYTKCLVSAQTFQLTYTIDTNILFLLSYFVIFANLQYQSKQVGAY